MSKYDQLITKIQTIKANVDSQYYLCSVNITPQEWELLEEALITLQLLETIFTIRERNLKKYHD